MKINVVNAVVLFAILLFVMIFGIGFIFIAYTGWTEYDTNSLAASIIKIFGQEWSTENTPLTDVQTILTTLSAIQLKLVEIEALVTP